MSDEEFRKAFRAAQADPSPENLMMLGRVCLRHFEAPQTHVRIEGRIWFNRKLGHSYHTATVYIDGRYAIKSDITYGYGNHFIHTGLELAIREGLLPPMQERQRRDQWEKANNIILETESQNVRLRREL